MSATGSRRWAKVLAACAAANALLFVGPGLAGLVSGGGVEPASPGGWLEAALLRRPGLELARVSVELALFVAALLVAPAHLRAPLRGLLSAYWVVLALFTAYDQICARVFDRPAALWEDLGYAHSLWRLLVDQVGVRLGVAAVVLVVVALAALVWLVSRLLGVVEAAAGRPRGCAEGCCSWRRRSSPGGASLGGASRCGDPTRWCSCAA